MVNLVIGYVGTAVVFLGIDFVWLTVMSGLFYRPQLGTLLAAEPNLLVAGAFYMVYAIGIVVFAVLPATQSGSWLLALGLGALLGLVAYGTYDFTNLATIRDWPVAVTLVDLAWGTALTALSALGGFYAIRLFGQA